jgi:hypothetical protein
VRVPVGVDLFGHVDSVPGMFYVATRCHHVWFLPLVPTGSWLVIDGSETTFEKENWWDRTERGSFRGIPIPFSAKSYATAWLRVLCAITGMLAVIAGGSGLLARAVGPGHMGALLLLFLLGLGLVLASWVLDRFTHAPRLSMGVLAAGMAAMLAIVGEHIPYPGALLPGGGALVAVAHLSLRFNRAGHERAMELAQQLGMSPELADSIFERLGIDPPGAEAPRKVPERVPRARTVPRPAAAAPPAPARAPTPVQRADGPPKGDPEFLK